MTAPTQDRVPLGGSYWKLFSASVISNLGDGIGLVAYPWLATAITRNALLIALVAVVQRLPWLFFSLPAGVITDRVDRRALMIGANGVRAVLTGVVALVVLSRQSTLPGPDEVETVVGGDTDLVLYFLILLATLLLGMAEVLYDNAGQTVMPSLVASANLEKANGRLWSAEQVANTFAGPPLGALLLAVAFSVPFFVDATTFVVSAALIALLPRSARSDPSAVAEGPGWRADLTEGFRWLWNHELLRPLAIILGLLNMLFTVTAAVMVLFAQEVLQTSATEFAILSTGGAIGGVLGGWSASVISQRIGSGTSLALTLLVGAVTQLATGLTSLWGVAWAMAAISMFVAVLWNVITVSLRQTIIPDHLLGRVNSVYRFFAWGMMPVGALIGGGIVSLLDGPASREVALRMPFFVVAFGQVVLAAGAIPRLTTAKIEAARTAAA